MENHFDFDYEDSWELNSSQFNNLIAELTKFRKQKQCCSSQYVHKEWLANPFMMYNSYLNYRVVFSCDDHH